MAADEQEAIAYSADMDYDLLVAATKAELHCTKCSKNNHLAKDCYMNNPCPTCKGGHGQKFCFYFEGSRTYDTTRAIEMRKTVSLDKIIAKNLLPKL